MEEWIDLPDLIYPVLAPGLVVIKNRYLYCFGGTSGVYRVQLLDL